MTTPLTGKVSWELWHANIRGAGVGHSVISTDLGQPFNPPVDDELAIVADLMLDEGYPAAEIWLMTVHNSRHLAGAEPLSDAPAHLR